MTKVDELVDLNDGPIWRWEAWRADRAKKFGTLSASTTDN